jgi:hypothetical protein
MQLGILVCDDLGHLEQGEYFVLVRLCEAVEALQSLRKVHLTMGGSTFVKMCKVCLAKHALLRPQELTEQWSTTAALSALSTLPLWDWQGTLQSGGVPDTHLRGYLQ